MNLRYSHILLPCALLLVISEQADCFSTRPSFARSVQGYRSPFPSSSSTTTTERPSPSLLYAANKRSSKKSATEESGTRRSRVSDPTGPTPEVEEPEPETIALADIPELKYDPNAHPIPHQPWRRGETAGCEDPIDAEWRVRAQEIMKTAVKMVGGKVLDVTWYLTACVVTIDEDNLEDVAQDFLKASGPAIELREPMGAVYKDPEDPSPEDIWADDEDTPIYERDDQAEADLKRQMYARKADDEEDLELDDDTDVPLYTSQETRGDDALRVAEEAEQIAENAERTVDVDTFHLDTSKLSSVAGAILDALETVEDELKVLTRHEIILTSPGIPDVLESQSQFDAHRGHEVTIETQDPWESNRTLRGTLVDRNSMDVILNQKGRMVTVPLNFIKSVRLKQASNKQDYDAEEDAAYDMDHVETEDDEGEVDYEADGEIDYEE
jgi:ribosome maturation factor RimP